MTRIRKAEAPDEAATTPTSEWRREAGTILVGSVAGVPVRVHGAFLILMVVFGAFAVAHGDWRQTLFLPGALFGLLIVTATARETDTAGARRLLDGLRVKDAMIDSLLTLSPGQQLGETAARYLPAWQPFFPVVHGTEVIGILARDRLLASRRDPPGVRRYVAGAMDRVLAFADAEEPLKEALARNPVLPSKPLIVTGGGQIVGIVTVDSLRRCLSRPRQECAAGAGRSETNHRRAGAPASAGDAR